MRTNRFLANDKRHLTPPGDIAGGGAHLGVLTAARDPVASQNDNGIGFAEETSAEVDCVGGLQVDVGSDPLELEVSELTLSNPISRDRTVDTAKLDDADLAAQGSAKLFRKQSKISAPSEFVSSETLLAAKPAPSRSLESVPYRARNDGPKQKAAAVYGGNNTLSNLKHIDDNSEFGSAYYSTHMPDFSLRPPFADNTPAKHSERMDKKRRLFKEILLSALITVIFLMSLFGIHLFMQDNIYETLLNYKSDVISFIDKVQKSLPLPEFHDLKSAAVEKLDLTPAPVAPQSASDVPSLPTPSSEALSDHRAETVAASTESAPQNTESVITQAGPIASRDQPPSELAQTRIASSTAEAQPVSTGIPGRNNSLDHALAKLGATKCIDRANQIVDKLGLGKFATLLQKPLGDPNNSLLVATLLSKEGANANGLSFLSVNPDLEHGCEGDYHAVTIVNKTCPNAIAEQYANLPSMKLGKDGISVVGLNEFSRVFALPVENSCVFIRQELMR